MRRTPSYAEMGRPKNPHVTHTLACIHTTLHVKCVSGEEEGVKNRCDTDELSSLVLVNFTNSPSIHKVIPITVKKNFPVNTRLLKGDQDC